MRYLNPLALIWTVASVVPGAAAATKSGKDAKNPPTNRPTPNGPLPNILIFLVDDLGYNQVGYNAELTSNTEIQTPHIDEHAKSGIIINRGYMMPWCAPSRATLQTGRTNSFNQNVSNDIWAFDDSIGFVGGMPPGTVTLAKALKDLSRDMDYGVYKTSYAGKWGIGGTAWSNTPMGMGYDEFLGFWGDSLESCDGWEAFTSVPFPREFQPSILTKAVPGYWQQKNTSADNVVCPYIREQTDLLTDEEIHIACKSTPKTPPKIIDLDIMEETVGIVRSHDYSARPLYHMHALQLMHLPMQYPKAYDDPDEAGKEKKPATNTDLRLSTRNAMRFVDDIFGNITQALKDAGQWHNTIIFFTSDNGGAIYLNTANNNFPLRGSKLNAFEGGIRVPQFLSGGWIENNRPRGQNLKSGTYVFVHDWAPTLLEMVGGPGSKKYLIGDRTGASYGNELWKYIQNSVSDPKKPSQLERYASYSLDLYFRVTETTTTKMIYTGDNGVNTPRHWNATWPMDGDLIPDLGYQSVKPCRKNRDTPYDCCFFDLEKDPGENYPKGVNCSKEHEISNALYDNKQICQEFPTICISNVTNEQPSSADVYSIWSHYGASGPFTNKDGIPIGKDLGMKCICDGFARDVASKSQASIKSFLPAVFSPYLCSDKNAPDTPDGTIHGVNCTGGFARVPQGGTLESFTAQGMDPVEMEIIMSVPFGVQLPNINRAWSEYLKREGFVEWPSFAKFPYIATLNSCPLKKATIVPLPVEALTPWIGSAPYGNPTKPTPKNNLCLSWTINKGWCPSKTNPEQKFVVSWDYQNSDPKGFFEDGSVFNPIEKDLFLSIEETCDIKCPRDAAITAYIVPPSYEHKWGIASSST